mmetsp:Transcript_137114/g.438445  ORF Transcript_137114/g.438445 Transcript_137114/m.438445 type:complete len:208 (+) Transcript_137114:1513-2136(+)
MSSSCRGLSISKRRVHAASARQRGQTPQRPPPAPEGGRRASAHPSGCDSCACAPRSLMHNSPPEAQAEQVATVVRSLHWEVEFPAVTGHHRRRPTRHCSPQSSSGPMESTSPCSPSSASSACPGRPGPCHRGRLLPCASGPSPEVTQVVDQGSPRCRSRCGAWSVSVQACSRALSTPDTYPPRHPVASLMPAASSASHNLQGPVHVH